MAVHLLFTDTFGSHVHHFFITTPIFQSLVIQLASLKVTVAQSCPTLCDPMDGSLSGPSVHGILQARKRVGCHSLLQRIFLTQGSNPGITHSLLSEPPGKPISGSHMPREKLPSRSRG